MRIHIGLDDTDSPRAGCTTYVALNLCRRLVDIGVVFAEVPRLVRLNPNIPWKTRGNGAVALTVEVEPGDLDRVVDVVDGALREFSDVEHGKSAPTAVLIPDPVPEDVKWLYRRALYTVVPLSVVERILSRVPIRVVSVKRGKLRGLIGALAAVGAYDMEDFTYEFLVYRSPENWGLERKVVFESVLEFDEVTKFLTFNNVDEEGERVLITPHGPDPVLYGVRGEDPLVLIHSLKYIRVEEEVYGWCLFRTNQGTDAHLCNLTTSVHPYDSITVRGVVIDVPRVLPGSHVILKVAVDGRVVECSVYRETGILRSMALKLRPGDVVYVMGGVRPLPGGKLTLNVEKIIVEKSTPRVVEGNVPCPRCGKTMTSLGARGGVKCRRCGFRISSIKIKSLNYVGDEVCGTWVASKRAHRHLTKPLERSGLEHPWIHHCPVVKWFCILDKVY